MAYRIVRVPEDIIDTLKKKLDMEKEPDAIVVRVALNRFLKQLDHESEGC